MKLNNRGNRRVCAVLTEAKNLTKVEPLRSGLAGATAKADIKGKIVESAWNLTKQGYAESTVKTFIRNLKRLSKESNLLNPESIKETLARHTDWKPSYKAVLTDCYNRFVEIQGLSWIPPSYKPTKELPFIPLEKEIDALIAGTSRKVAAVLQLLKETGVRIGEAWALKWIDIDQDRQSIKCKAEKHGNPRMFKASSKLLAMLNSLPKDSEYVFRRTNLLSFRSNYTRQRRSIADKLKNPRILKISFHTFRHWKATMEYHRTKDILYVKNLLGHRKIESTMVYTQLIAFENEDHFTCRVAKDVQEAKQLVEAGFDYVTDIDSVKLFRKRK